jgi:tRNA pseudouridine55 synthase
VTTPEGYLVIDKPAGCTSHDVVARCRRLLSTRRVGHAGTLDPDATGVLVVGVGRATRLLRYASSSKKSYVGEVAFGVSTSTLDAAGEVTGRVEMGGLTLEQVRQAAVGLTGRIEQVPPMVSALKVGGRRLHELAREGLEVDRAPRPVDVSRLDVFETGEEGIFRIHVECSAGTYVRVLAADLGEHLGGLAHLRSLRRLAVGSFSDKEAVPLEEVSPEVVAPPAGLVRDLQSARLTPELVRAISQGKSLERNPLGLTGEGPWALLDADGALVAVAEGRGRERLQPVVVLQAAG